MNWNELDNDQRRDAVSDLIRQDMTAAKMSAELNTSRNAIIGFCRRNNIPLANATGPRQKRVKLEPVVKPVLVPPKKPKLEWKRPPAHKLTGNTVSKPTRKIDVANDISTAVSFLDALGRGLCKWPLWSAFEGPTVSMCCGGKRITARPYCEFHEEIHQGRGTTSERKAGAELRRHVA